MFSINNNYLRWRDRNRMLLGRFGVKSKTRVKKKRRALLGIRWWFADGRERERLYGGNHGG